MIRRLEDGTPSWVFLAITLAIVLILGLLSAWACVWIQR